MSAAVAALICLFVANVPAPSATPRPGVEPAAAPAIAISAAAPNTALAPMPSSPLPGSPRSVSIERSAEGLSVTWQPPTRTGETPLAGYVILVGGTATLVDANTTRLALASPDSRVAVTAMNGVGCSLPVEARVLVASRLSR